MPVCDLRCGVDAKSIDLRFEILDLFPSVSLGVGMNPGAGDPISFGDKISG